MSSLTTMDPRRSPYTRTRREFLAAGGAAGLMIGLAPIGRSASATANRGGHLRFGSAHGATTDTLDPSFAANDFMTSTVLTVYGQLTEVNSQGQLEPLLAESWEASDGAKQWTFKLRKGIEFHNGKSFDADDVIANIDYHRDENSKSTAKSLASQIAAIKKDDSHTVICTLQEGNADFPFMLSAFQLGIMPAHDGKVDTSGIGTGAYSIETFEPGVRAVFKRNPNFFKEGRAHFDSCEMLTIANVAGRQAALVSGEVDLVSKVDLKTVHLLLANNPDIEVLSVAGMLHYTFPMRTDTPPFDNNDVRLALKYAIDRQELVDKLLFGYGALGNDHPISPANRFFAKELPQRTFDPDKAKFHLKKAGLSSLRVDLSTAEAAFPEAVDAVVLYQEQAKKAGLDINVVREANDGYYENVWLKKPWCVSYWSGRPTEDWMFSQAYADDSNWNDTFWKHERFNALLRQARAELDEAKRREMYVEMQTIVRDEGGAVIPMFANHVSAHSKKLAHEEHVAGNWESDGGKLIERWWFA